MSFMNIFEMSLSTCALILVVIVIRSLAINKLPRLTFTILWGVIVVKLLLPISVPSMFSFSNLFVQSKIEQLPSIISDRFIGFIPSGLTTIAETSTIPTQSIPLNYMSVIWALGVMVVTLFFAYFYIRCVREFRMAVLLTNETDIQSLLFCYKPRSTIKVMISDKIKVPLSYGIFHPVILFPNTTDWNDKRTLMVIVAHEVTHINRFDALWKLVLAGTLALHWFNPLVWVMFFLANRDIEISCDEKVVKLFGESIKSAYANALISLEESKGTLYSLTNSFAKNSIEERIRSIMKIKKNSALAVTIAAILVIGATTVFATGAVFPTSIKDNALFSRAQLIDNKNSSLIGSEVIDDTPPMTAMNTPKTSNSESVAEFYVPENSVVKELGDEGILPPVSIENFEAVNGILPEVIMTNGSAVLFTQEGLNGWTCKTGDKLLYEFEKYESSVVDMQTMVVGYVLNGALYLGEIVKDLSGTYQLEVEKEGDYYICVISATSDYLALKKGAISIVSND